MHAQGHISDTQLAEVSAQPVEADPAPPPPNGCAGEGVLGGFFCDLLQDHLTGTLGMTQEQLEDGGLTIRTTMRSEEHTSELQSRQYLVCRLLLEKKKKNILNHNNIYMCIITTDL